MRVVGMLALCAAVCALQVPSGMMGEWKLDSNATNRSSDPLFKDIRLYISVSAAYDASSSPQILTVRQRFVSSSSGVSDLWFNVTSAVGDCSLNLIGTHVWTQNPFFGLRFLPGAKASCCVSVQPEDAVVLHEAMSVHASQGLINITQSRSLSLSGSGGSELSMVVSRSTRDKDAPLDSPP